MLKIYIFKIFRSIFYLIRLNRLYFLQITLHFLRYSFRQRLTKNQKKFRSLLSFFSTKVDDTNGILLTQIVEDYEYTIKLAAAAKVIADKMNLQIQLIEIHIHENLGRSLPFTGVFKKLVSSANEKIHLGFATKVAFRNSDLFFDQNFIKQKLGELRLSLETRENLLALHFDDILVGDLIYDTYLRFFHQPTIADLDDDVFKIVEIALNIYYNFLSFIKESRIKCFVSAFAGYIQHAIPVRVCHKFGIPVFTMGSRSYLLQKFDDRFPYCSIDHTKFHPDRTISNENIQLAKEILTSRFEGKVDAATFYMKESSFSDKVMDPILIELFKKRKRNVVIYAHEFYDAPHINRLLLYPDLYQYLKSTLESLADAEDTTIFIKTHPGGLPGTKEKTIELVNSLNVPHFIILNESVSNKHIVELKPDLIVTARGSIGVEMAYFGFPVVALFDNPYANFRFVHTCYDSESYISIIKGFKKPLVVLDRTEIFSYYYQAFLERKINAKDNIFELLSKYGSDTYSENYLSYLESIDIENKRKELLLHYSNALAKIAD